LKASVGFEPVKVGVPFIADFLRVELALTRGWNSLVVEYSAFGHVKVGVEVCSIDVC
jgi:hypothetical protein